MEINLLDDSQLALLRQLTADASSVVVTVHKSPDGDAIGSMLAWAQYLQALGKEVTCVIPDAAPDFLMWLPGSQTLLRYDKHPDRAKEAFDKADLVCCLDFNDLSRTGDMADVIAQSKAPRLLIDHHVGPTVEAALSVSHPAMSSTSELVFRLLWQLGAYDEMTLQMAQCIYCGMMTDTGAFTYNSNAPAVYLIISHLLEKGVDKDRVYNRVYHNYSPQAIKFRSYVIFKKLRVLPASHAAYYTVTRDEMRRFQFVRGDLEGVVNIPQKIKTQTLHLAARGHREGPGHTRQPPFGQWVSLPQDGGGVLQRRRPRRRGRRTPGVLHRGSRAGGPPSHHGLQGAAAMTPRGPGSWSVGQSLMSKVAKNGRRLMVEQTICYNFAVRYY